MASTLSCSDKQAAALGYVLSQQWFLRDHEVGGYTQRRRVFLVWEKADVASACGPWPTLPSPPPVPAAIQDALVDASQVPSACWLGGRHSLNMHVQVLSDRATCCGSVTLRGDIDNLAVGALVSLRYHRDGLNKWRVMAFKGHRIELRRADRKQPDFALVRLNEISHTCPDTIKVYHPRGIGITLRSWGEPPLRSGFAVAQLTPQGWQPRTLLASECWKLQSLSEHTLVQLLALGATEEQVASAAGNAITGAAYVATCGVTASPSLCSACSSGYATSSYVVPQASMLCSSQGHEAYCHHPCGHIASSLLGSREWHVGPLVLIPGARQSSQVFKPPGI